MLRKRSGFSFFSILCFTLILSVLATYNFSVANDKIIENFNNDTIKTEAYLIDCALNQWAKNHSGEYPNELKSLVSIGIMSQSVRLEKYNYDLKLDKKSYSLTTKLLNGNIYKSPLSSS